MATYKDGVHYECEILQQGFCESKEKKTPGFFLKFRPVGEIDSADPTQQYECPQYERKIEMWLTDKTIDRQIEVLRGLGFTGSSFRELDPELANSFAFVGHKIELVCRHEPGSDGKIYDKFEIPYQGSPLEIANDSKVASKLDNLFGKRLRSTAPKPTPAAVESASDDAGNDDIPF